MRDRSPGCATWLPSPTCGDCSMRVPGLDLSLGARHSSGASLLQEKDRAAGVARPQLVDRDGRCRRTIAQQRRQLPAEATRLETLVRLRDLFGPPPTVPARPAAFALVQPRRVDLG